VAGRDNKIASQSVAAPRWGQPGHVPGCKDLCPGCAPAVGQIYNCMGQVI